MKTRSIQSLKVSNTITLLLSILIIASCTGIIASCTGQQDATQEENATPSTQTKVKPPEIDIHTAVITDNKEALNQHIAAGSNLNEKDPFGGSSPLISAAVFGKPEMAKILIDAGADLNFQNNEGSTPLLTAAFFCRPEIVQMLLDKGADKTIRNKYGATAYESVAAPFDDVKNAYDMMGTMLGPMGLELDYNYIEKTRPEIAAMLQ